MVSDFLCNSPKSKANMKKINTTKDNVEKTVAVKNESKEERKEIKYETDNKRATLDYL